MDNETQYVARINGAEHAFARPYSEYGQSQSAGLTKREYFAGLALQGLIASFTEKAAIGSWGTEIPEAVNVAVKYADALLLELAK